MRKIPTALLRDPENRAKVLPRITPGCEWVFDGEGVPTRKYDGTCVMLNSEGWWARREVRAGKPAPANFVPVDTDPVTGKTQGWEPIEQSSFHRWFLEAEWLSLATPTEGERTFELCGPKINGDPEHIGFHVLFEHAQAEEFPWMLGRTTPDILMQDVAALSGLAEGVVWHHPDGRMAKLKVRDV